ncbi:class II aldolase/adducin family protein [Marinovum sp.]|uniref:class II aldolase/adducin family protein n=1 Tax=Marinovum sp. TaxID=2024839 RepID=UPI003A8E70AE
MKDIQTTLRQSLVDACQSLASLGLTQGTSGNVSVRCGDKMLISPSATPYEDLTPEMIVEMPLDRNDGTWSGPLKPSTEWRFHLDMLQSRSDVNAVVHGHPTYCTALAIARKSIPRCHYMIAAFGGDDVRCAGYARFGSEELSELVKEAMKDRTACLMANHGALALGSDLRKALWRAVELEAIAQQYYLSLAIGGPVLLSEEDIAETHQAFGGYGLQDQH